MHYFRLSIRYNEIFCAFLHLRQSKMANDASAQIDNDDGIYFTSQYKLKEAMESRIAALNEMRTSSSNEEYVYWGSYVSNDRQTNDHEADVVYYDIDTTHFEPDPEYLVSPQDVNHSIMRNTKEANFRKSEMSSPSGQDVYDEDGYTLARTGSYVEDGSTSPHTEINSKQSNQFNIIFRPKIKLIVAVGICIAIISGLAGFFLVSQGILFYLLFHATVFLKKVMFINSFI